MSPPLIAIFGAAVHSDGRPSAALLRRTRFGYEAAQRHPGAPILCSGGALGAGPSQASVMSALLKTWDLDAARLILDEESRDTVQNVVATGRAARERRCPRVVVCSDAYHVPRIRMMLSLLDIPSEPGPLPPGRGGAPLAHWSGMVLREGLAIPYDLLVVLARRRELAARIAAS